MNKPSVTMTRLTVLFPLATITLALMLTPASGQTGGRSNGHSAENVKRDGLTGNYNPTYNPNQIAILRWYQANTGPTVFSVPVTSAGTHGTVFDGTNIWVLSTNLDVFNINGQRLNAVPISLGGEPIGLAYDGSNIWVSNLGIGLQKVNVVSHVVSTVSVPGLAYPYFLAFDGSHIWVTDTTSNAVWAVSINAPYLAKKFPVGQGPTGIAFDGDCMWVTDTNDGTVWTVPDPYGFNCQINGGVAGPVNWKAGNGTQPFNIAYDGTNMWVTVRFANQVVELDDSVNPGYLLNTVTVGYTPQAVAFDGAYIWVANSSSGTVTKLTATNNPNAPPGTVVGTYGVKPGTSPGSLTFDGANMWTVLGGTFVGKM